MQTTLSTGDYVILAIVLTLAVFAGITLAHKVI